MDKDELRCLEMGLKKPRISYETSFRAKAIIAAVAFGILIFMIVYYPLLAHDVNPFDVAAPKGQIVMASNFTIGDVSYVNAVAFTSQNNLLVLKGNDNAGDTLTMKVVTPDWCVDLWVWGGPANGWQLKSGCSRELEMSQYAFKRLPTHEAKEILYWYLEPGYLLVFHKEGAVQNYEIVNFTVTYGGSTGGGYFKVAVKGS
ncbi:hypothetical protein A3L11_03060 [Thermococcus siculi]|uniref:Uncharacterized protein n=1 Tax=Thermococcus siculi TaxID=72803 RepID=A0A2Z2MIN6_9EURY|nr:hypothetical protein [Thermococcus siculi]ASJ08259.1 hypothetical protein A3L11_03060 [Thermococcus siculi]